MISTRKDHDSTLVQTNKKGRNGKIIEKRSCILDYNNAKKGVDLSDQLSTYYNALRKGRKWYRKVAFEIIIGTAIINS